MCVRHVVVVIIPWFSNLPRTAKQQRRVDVGWEESLEAVINRVASFSVWMKRQRGRATGCGGPPASERVATYSQLEKEDTLESAPFLALGHGNRVEGALVKKHMFCQGHCHSRVDVWLY